MREPVCGLLSISLIIRCCTHTRPANSHPGLSGNRIHDTRQYYNHRHHIRQHGHVTTPHHHIRRKQHIQQMYTADIAAQARPPDTRLLLSNIRCSSPISTTVLLWFPIETLAFLIAIYQRHNAPGRRLKPDAVLAPSMGERYVNASSARRRAQELIFVDRSNCYIFLCRKMHLVTCAPLGPAHRRHVH